MIIERKKNKKEQDLPEIIIPTLFNTYDRPKEVNNYSCWIDRHVNSNKCQIYINGKWFEFIRMVQDDLKPEDEIKIYGYTVSKKEYEFLNSFKKFLKGNKDV